MSSRGNSSGEGSGSQTPTRPVISLVPTSTGTFDLQPSRVILECSRAAYRARMSRCWPKWDLIPPHIQEVIWQDVLAEVDFETDDLQLARTYWVQKMRKCYKDGISTMKKNMKKPPWMGAAVWEGFLKYWDSDEAKTESERNSANRNKNPVTHRGGSKSFQQYRQELEAEGQGPVSYMDVFTRTHAIESLDSEGNTIYTWHDDKSRKSHEKFMEQRQQRLAETGQEQLTTDEEDIIFQSVMDPMTRNRRYGFGNQVSTSKQARGKQSRADTAEIEELRARVAQLEEQNRRQAIETTQLLDRRLAEFAQQYGRFPSSTGSTEDNDEDDE